MGMGCRLLRDRQGRPSCSWYMELTPRAAWEQRKARGKGAEGIGKGVGGTSGQEGEEKRADRQNEGTWEWLCLSATVEQCNWRKG